MKRAERLVEVYCSNNSFEILHLANHLENEGIERKIIGYTAAVVLGIENPTQQVCIRVFQRDVIKAKAIINQLISLK